MFKKILSVLLICSMLLALLVSCGKSSDDVAQTTQNAEQQDTTLTLIENGKANFRIVANQMEIVKNPLLETKLNKLVDDVKKKLGVEIEVAWTSKTEYDANSNDILIGSTGYEESIAAATDLKLKDYKIIQSGKKIVIVGGSVDALSAAITYFANNTIAKQIKPETTTIVFTVDNQKEYYAKYFSNDILINGKDLKEYTIVIPKNFKMAEQETAYILKDLIATQYGYALPVENDVKTYENEILIGNTARTTIAAPALTEYTVEVTDKNVQILAGCTSAYGYIDDLFNKQFFPQSKIESAKADALSDYQTQKDSILGTTGDIRMIFHNVHGMESPQEGVNTNATLRWNLECNLYQEYQADILCLQEFNNLPRNQGLKTRLLNAGYAEVPTSKYKLTTVKDANKVITSTSLTKNSADANQEVHTPIFYDPNKLELLKYGDYVYQSGLTDDEINALYDLYGGKLATRNDTPAPAIPEKATQAQWDMERYNDNFRYGGISKMAVWAIFKDKTTGKIFAVASTHLDHQDTAYSNERRIKEAAELLNEFNTNVLVGEYADIPLIFGGDVNTSYTREVDKYHLNKNTPTGALQDFEAAGFKDVQKTFADADQTSSYGGHANFDFDKNYYVKLGTSHPNAAEDSIDHCLYKGAVTPTLFDIMDHEFARRTSDHLPLVVDFTLD